MIFVAYDVNDLVLTYNYTICEAIKNEKSQKRLLFLQHNITNLLPKSASWIFLSMYRHSHLDKQLPTGRSLQTLWHHRLSLRQAATHQQQQHLRIRWIQDNTTGLKRNHGLWQSDSVWPQDHRQLRQRKKDA